MQFLTNNGTFESSVISYGSKAGIFITAYARQFESSVISYGSKAQWNSAVTSEAFESSVISYGSKAEDSWETVRNTV